MMKCLVVGFLLFFGVLSPIAAVDIQDHSSGLDHSGDISDKTYGFTLQLADSSRLVYSFFKRDGIPVDHHVTLKRAINITYYNNYCIGFAPGQPIWHNELVWAGVGLEPGQSHNEGTLDYTKNNSILDSFSTKPSMYYLE